MSDTDPAVGSRWQHRNGNFYTVLRIANEPDEERYPKTVVYQGDNKRVWARRASDWHRSMTLVSDASTSASETSGRRLKSLQWSEATPPNSECPYDHSTAATSLGLFRIEWKSWKDYPSFTLHFREDFVDSYVTQTAAKEGAAAHLKKIVADLFEEEPSL